GLGAPRGGWAPVAGNEGAAAGGARRLSFLPLPPRGGCGCRRRAGREAGGDPATPAAGPVLRRPRRVRRGSLRTWMDDRDRRGRRRAPEEMTRRMAGLHKEA